MKDSDEITTTVSDEGTIRWYKGRTLHREDGPAVIYPDGEQHWRKNGMLHRTDGPAIIEPDGETWFFVDDVRCYNWKSFQCRAKLSDEETTALALKYSIYKSSF